MEQNQSIDEYIRSILGYPSMNMVTNNNMNYMRNDVDQMQYEMPNENKELESYYPEIYKIVYPMINKRCSQISEPITQNLINEITNEIYSSIEVSTPIKVNINLQNQVQEVNNRNNRKQISESENTKKENRGDDRQTGNSTLNDLIRILILRELLARPGRPPRPRPPFPGPRWSATEGHLFLGQDQDHQWDLDFSMKWTFMKIHFEYIMQIFYEKLYKIS